MQNYYNPHKSAKGLFGLISHQIKAYGKHHYRTKNPVALTTGLRTWTIEHKFYLPYRV